jgi:hypothetical protein
LEEFVFCQQCGNKLSEDALFCENCGTKITVNDDEQNVETPENNTNTVEPQVIKENLPPATVQEESVFCTNCGSNITDDAVFCTNCGQTVQTDENASAAPVTAIENIPPAPAPIMAEENANAEPEIATPDQPPATVQEKYVFCTNCGTKIEDGSQFCGNCGTSVAFNSAPQQQVNYIAPAANAQQTNAQTNYVPPTQPNYAAPLMAMPNIPVQKSSMDATGLVLDVLSVVLGLIYSGGGDNRSDIMAFIMFISVFPLGLAGVILSAIAISRNKKAGQSILIAITALVVSLLGIVLLIRNFMNMVE